MCFHISFSSCLDTYCNGPCTMPQFYRHGKGIHCSCVRVGLPGVTLGEHQQSKTKQNKKLIETQPKMSPPTPDFQPGMTLVNYNPVPVLARTRAIKTVAMKEINTQAAHSDFVMGKQRKSPQPKAAQTPTRGPRGQEGQERPLKTFFFPQGPFSGLDRETLGSGKCHFPEVAFFQKAARSDPVLTPHPNGRPEPEDAGCVPFHLLRLGPHGKVLLLRELRC